MVVVYLVIKVEFVMIRKKLCFLGWFVYCVRGLNVECNFCIDRFMRM